MKQAKPAPRNPADYGYPTSDLAALEADTPERAQHLQLPQSPAPPRSAHLRLRASALPAMPAHRPLRLLPDGSEGKELK